MKEMSQRLERIVICGGLGLALMLALTSSAYTSQTIDEGAHIAAGASYLDSGDFRLNVEHPPLVKLLTALPLRSLPLTSPTRLLGWADANQWEVSRHFLYDNTVNHFTILMRARLPLILLSLLLPLAVWSLSRRLFGQTAGLVAFGLTIFEPTLLAHGQLVTTDMAVTIGYVGTLLAFDAFSRRPGSGRLVLLGIVFGLTLGSKFSGVFLFPVLLLLWAIVRWRRPFPWSAELTARWFSWSGFWRFLIGIVLIPTVVIIALYGGETLTMASDPFISQWRDSALPTDGVVGVIRHLLDSGPALWVMDHVPIPAYRYLKGLATVAVHDYYGHDSYLLGEFRTFGWWYYFPVAFAVKTSAGLLILLILSIVAGGQEIVGLARGARIAVHSKTTTWWRRLGIWSTRWLGAVPYSHWLLFIPFLIVGVVSLTSHINLGVRHILPLYPLVIIAVSRLFTLRHRLWPKLWTGLLSVFAAFVVLESLLIYPHYLSFFNVFAGGPSKGHEYLLDSNIDWSQDLWFLRQYMQQHEIPVIYLSLFGNLRLDAYDIQWQPLPSDPIERRTINGFAAISLTNLYDKNHAYDWLQQLKPVGRAGYSILIYDLRRPPR